MRKIILTAAFGFAAVLAIGYATAFFSRKNVEKELRREVMAKNIHGLGLLGEKIPPAKIQIHAEVKYPFVVEGHYFVPIDMHGRYHTVKYVALPWGIYPFSTQNFYPI